LGHITRLIYIIIAFVFAKIFQEKSSMKSNHAIKKDGCQPCNQKTPRILTLLLGNSNPTLSSGNL
jgi:hypothetical protein